MAESSANLTQSFDDFNEHLRASALLKEIFDAMVGWQGELVRLNDPPNEKGWCDFKDIASVLAMFTKDITTLLQHLTLEKKKHRADCAHTDAIKIEENKASEIIPEEEPSVSEPAPKKRKKSKEKKKDKKKSPKLPPILDNSYTIKIQKSEEALNPNWINSTRPHTFGALPVGGLELPPASSIPHTFGSRSGTLPPVPIPLGNYGRSASAPSPTPPPPPPSTSDLTVEEADELLQSMVENDQFA